MLYRQFKNFRDLNLKTFKLYNVPSKYKNTKLRTLEEPLIGIFYINHNMGLNLLIVGDKYEDNIKDKILITNDDNFEYIDFTETKTIPEYIAKIEEYYEDPELIKTRSIKKIDEFRHADYPDDLEVLIPLSDKRVEQVWVRLIKVIDEDTYIGTLLHSSSEINKLTESTQVLLKYHKEPKFNSIILDSIYKDN